MEPLCCFSGFCILYCFWCLCFIYFCIIHWCCFVPVMGDCVTVRCVSFWWPLGLVFWLQCKDHWLVLVGYFLLPEFWPLVGSLWWVGLLLCCCTDIACVNCTIKKLRALSENVAKLSIESVLVVEEATVMPGFAFLALFLGVQDVLVAVVLKVDIDPDSKSSCIFVIMSAGVVSRLTLHHAFNLVDVSTRQKYCQCVFSYGSLTILIPLLAYCSGPQCGVLGKGVGLGTSLHEGLSWCPVDFGAHVTRTFLWTCSSYNWIIKIIQDGLPSHDSIEAAHQICPGMITVLTYMFHRVRGMTTHPDLDEVGT